MPNNQPIKNSKFYSRWRAMKDRCYNKKDRGFRNYGGRGITICKDWMNFRNFEKWCLETYQEGKTIDRKNNDLGYSPRNCRWATKSEQKLNSRFTQRCSAALGSARKILLQKMYEQFGNPRTRKTKRCGSCKKVKYVKNFCKNKSRTDGLQQSCYLCTRKSNKRYYDSHQARLSASSRPPKK